MTELAAGDRVYYVLPPGYKRPHELLLPGTIARITKLRIVVKLDGHTWPRNTLAKSIRKILTLGERMSDRPKLDPRDVADAMNEALRADINGVRRTLKTIISEMPPLPTASTFHNDNFDVGQFHQKFGLDNTARGVGPRLVSKALMAFRIKFLREELQEFEDAYATGDHAKMFDSLIDLVYVAHGTAHVLGYPWTRGWDAVQTANMAKERATSETQSTRGSTFDVVKPEGWKPPDIEGLLRAFGWEIE